MKSYLISLTLVISGFLPAVNAQPNLVTNGSFEIHSGICPTSSPNGAFSTVADWSPANIIPGHGVPHAELYCGGTPNYGNCLPGPPGASNGDAYVGFHTRNISQPYNEAIYQSLSAPLVPGNSYRVSFDLMDCQSGLFILGPSDFCVYANNDTTIPGCPTQNPAVILLGCVPYDSISNVAWKHHEIDFIAPANANVLAFSGGTCFITDVYYYLDNVELTSTTSLIDVAGNTGLNYTLGPNPFFDNISLEIFQPGIFSYELCNVSGQQVAQGKINGNQSLQIPVPGNQACGIYYMKIRNNASSVVTKMVKLSQGVRP